MSEAMKDVKEKELQDLQNRIQSTQQSAEEKIGTKRQDMLKPITEKADKAIQAVAKEKGYTYILDASVNGVIIYATPTDNIIEDVKTKLGIPKTAPVTAPTSTGTPKNKNVNLTIYRKPLPQEAVFYAKPCRINNYGIEIEIVQRYETIDLCILYFCATKIKHDFI